MYKRVLFATDFDEVGIIAAHKAKKLLMRMVLT